MRVLSNIFGLTDAGGGEPLQSRVAGESEHIEALRLILGSDSGAAASDNQVVDFLNFCHARDVDLGRLWIVCRGKRLLWAVLPLKCPGKTMLLFCPQSPPPMEARDLAAAMIQDACAHDAADNVHLAQILLDPGAEQTGQIIARCGFERLAELIYLHGSVPAGCKTQPALPAWNLLHYQPQTHQQFVDAISASYQQSLDCPALSGRRDMADVIEGHQAAGQYDPQLWTLLLEDQKPLGVLILARIARSALMELVYLGLCPEARGRGIGDWMMNYAFCAAAARQCQGLSLAVDAINKPALNLYFRHGMRRLCSKIAWMRDLRTGDLATP